MTSKTTKSLPGFNGAATFRPRKETPRDPSRPAGRSFNGAATFRPRKAETDDLAARDPELQWGRDLSAAEGAGMTSDDPNPSWLQWGRDLSAAEGSVCARTE